MKTLFEVFARDHENVWKLFTDMNDGLIITDQKLNIIAINPAFEKISGYNFNDVYNKTPRIFQSGKTNREIFNDMWYCIDNNGTWTGELINKRKNGEEFHSYITITHIKKEKEENSYYIGVMRDITDKRRAVEKISHLAFHDTLTGLSNRFHFTKTLRRQIRIAKDNDQIFAVIFLDLDRFKNVNDTLGHHVGDQLLVQVAKRLTRLTGDNGLVSRFGGDEFVFLLNSIQTQKGAEKFIDTIIEAFQKPFECGGEVLYITCSIGVCFYPDHGLDVHTLLKNADRAMYKSKDESRNNYQIYTSEMNEGSVERLKIETELHQAFAKNEFEVYYQMQVDTKTGEPCGVEALVRWNHPQKGVIPPGLFLPVAEETGLIIEIDEWVMRTACKQTKDWHDQGLTDLMVSVNISQQQFDRYNFVDIVKRALYDSGLPANKLCIEITENTAILNVERAISKLTELRTMGIHVSLDDFGTGYSSLSQLQKFPIDSLKIDQSFVRNTEENEESFAIVKLIIGMAKNLKFTVTCEGVETEAQLTFIRNEGCEHAQGFFFSKPVDSKTCEQLMRKMKKISGAG